MRKFKLYAWDELAEYKIEKYNPLLDTGGFGLKIRLNVFRNRGRMTVYNLSGNIALKLNLNNGRKVWIGTENGVEMQRFLENLNTESGKRRGK